jgi:dihydrofolate synthase/folylpolyglutamate synthase
MVLAGLNPDRWILGLERMRKALEILGHPEGSYPHVLVAGTNGKGSTCVFLERILAASGLSVGTTLSPHLSRFTERFRIGGVEADASELESLRASAASALEALGLTYFEWCVVLAAMLFSRRRVDFGIFEVGLGGRDDATNALDPVLSVVTDVSMDHTDFLGGTVEEIALEKACIARPGRPLVTCASGGALDAIRSHARSVGAPIHIVNDPPGTFGDWMMPHQRRNAAAALVAAGILGYGAEGRSLTAALRGAFLPGRLEWFGDRVVLDVAHNEASVLVLIEHLASRGFDGAGVAGILADKDYRTMIRHLAGACRRLYIAPVKSPRSWGATEMENVACFGGITVCESVDQAFSRALASSMQVFVTGSFYTVAEVRERLWCRGWVS